jgi:hypothetical protein
MRFHITWEVRDTIVLDEDKRMREVLGPHLQRVMESGKVQDSGLLCGKRGASLSSRSMPPRNYSNCWVPKFTPTLRRTCSH